MTIIKTIGIILGLILSLLAFNAFIDSKIESRFNDPIIISRIAKQIRPFLIFSGTGAILVDSGAKEYIVSLKIIPDSKSRIPEKIIVEPKQHMANAPLITPIDQISAVALPKRGTGVTWEYTFNYTYVMENEGPKGPTTAHDDRYRLEIIH